MKRLLTVIICLFLFLCACATSDINDNTPTPEPSPTASVTEDARQSPVPIPTGEYEPPADIDLNTKFILTDAQQELFDKYSKDFNFDISVFRDAAPIDVAQVFIECGLHGFWEGEYNLYYFESRTVSKADYKTESEENTAASDIRDRRFFADIMYPFLKDGKFVDTGDDSGYIEFVSIDSNYVDLYEVNAKMNLKKIDGIWMINQNNPFEVL